MKNLSIAALALLAAAPASAQGPHVTISDKAAYADALTCYQYYTLAAQLARKLEQDPKASADQAAGFELQALAARRALAAWSLRVDAAAGARTKQEIDVDLKKLGAPVVADANAAVAGDKTAAARGRSRGDKCAKFEVVSLPAKTARN
jgi:hypothetical protein